MSAPSQNLWTVVFNPKAGHNDQKKARRLQRALEAEEINFKWIAADSAASAANLITSAIDDGSRHLLSVGGDGTNNKSINVFMNTPYRQDMVYALLPWGTGNDWAAQHHLSRNEKVLASSMKTGKVKEVVLGAVSTQDGQTLFTNTLGIGFDAFVVQKMQDSGKIGKWSYLMEIVKSLKQYTGDMVAWQQDGLEKLEEVFSLHLGIGPTTGGGLKITPHATNGEQGLAMTLIKEDSRIKYLQSLGKLLSGKIFNLSFVETAHVANFKVPDQGRNVVVECDGEICGAAPFEVKMHDERLNLLDTSGV